MKRILIVLTLIITTSIVYGQNTYSVSAGVLDSLEGSLIGANVWLINGKDSLHTVTDSNGQFIFKQVPIPSFSIKITLLGYNAFNKSFLLPAENHTIKLPNIYMNVKSNFLKEVIVKSKASPIILKGDTIEYTINQYQLRKNAQLDDLIKRLPGFEVDRAGNIKFMGQPVKKIKVNGKEFAITNINDLLQLLPLELLEKVQVIDDYGKMSALTGRSTGLPLKVLNLNTKKDLNLSYNLKVELGSGSAGRHLGGLQGSIIDNKKQLIFNGRTNNSVPGPGQTSYNSGIFFYRNQLTEWLYTNGGISFEQQNHKERSYTNVISQTSDGASNINNNYTNSSNFNNYSFGETLKVDYKKNSLNIELLGRRKSQTDNVNTISTQTGVQHIDQIITNLSNSVLPNMSAKIYGAHHINKKGQLFAFGFNYNYNGNTSNNNINNNTTYYNVDNTHPRDSQLVQIINKQTDLKTILFESSYVSSFSQDASLEIKYVLSSNQNISSQETQWRNNEGKMKIIDSLSTHFNFLRIEQKIGFNFKRSGNLIEYVLGGDFYFASYGTNKGRWFIPNANVSLKLNRVSRLNFNCDISPVYPGFQQLQPLPDRSNPLFPIIGNPTLKAGLTNTFSLDYRYTSTSIFFVSLSANFLSSQTVTNTVLTPDTLNTLKQETRYLNANGIYSYSGNYAWSRPFFDSKIQLFIEGNANFNNNIFYLQNVKNYSQNVTLTQSLRTGIYQKWIELNTGASYTLNHTNYSDKEVATVNIHTWMINLNTKFFAGPSWSLWLDVNKQFNTGYAANVSANPTDLTATIEKTFLKNKLSFRLQGFNLLNQNTGISQTISANTTTQTRTNQLGRYILLSAILDLKKTKK